jgi:hypothetical protein
MVLGNSGLSVFFNSGDGTFGPELHYGAGSSTAACIDADFDGRDGPDIAYASGGEVHVLFNLGDGTLGGEVVLPALPEITSMAVADLDGVDGPDLIVVAQSGDELLIILNNGDGSFRDEPAVRVGSGASSVWAGNLDEVGAPEILVEVNFVTVLSGCVAWNECSVGAIAELEGLMAVQQGADIALSWQGDRSAADGYNVWYVTEKSELPACEGCAGSTAVAGCNPTGSQQATTCVDIGAVAGGAGDRRYYNARGVCQGTEAAE